MKRILLDSLLWPAVAGHVIWSFMSLVVTPRVSLPVEVRGTLGIRIWALEILGLYLAAHFVLAGAWDKEWSRRIAFAIVNVLGLITLGLMWNRVDGLQLPIAFTVTCGLYGLGKYFEKKWSELRGANYTN